MPTRISLSLPEPCTENWQQMTPTGCGRFCAACQKTVIDFTGMTDGEVIAILKGQENVCGRFAQHQLGRELATTQGQRKYKLLGLHKIAASLLAASTLFSEALAQQVKKPEKAVAASPQQTGRERLHNHVFGEILGLDNETTFSDIQVNAYEPVTKILLGSGVSDAKGAVSIDLGFYPGDTVLLSAEPGFYIEDVLATVNKPGAFSYFKMIYPFLTAEDALPPTVIVGYPSARKTDFISGAITTVTVEDSQPSFLDSFWGRIKRLLGR